MNTPGHTPEHLAFLVTDGAVASEPMGVITGDSLFVGDVGRPDLLVKTGALGHDVSADRDAAMRAMESSARTLFHTVQRLRDLPEHLQVWPGHGAGSPCGKSLGAVPQTTIGYELRFNWAFAVHDEEEFVGRILEGQPEPPRYFARMKRLNREGPPAPALVSAPVALQGEALATLQRGGTILVDTRPVRAFTAGHIPGSINVPLDRSFLIRAGSVLPDDAIVALLVDGGLPLAQRAIHGLSLIGVDDVRGVFDSSALDWQEVNGGLASTPLRAPADVARDDGAQIIDVRGATEYAAGHIPGALNVPLPELADRVAALPAGPLVLHCQGGTRSAIAASLVRAGGRDDVSDMEGGFAAWERAGLPVESDAGRPDGEGAKP
jgi:hydroxyacylglutathione hydrolase